MKDFLRKLFGLQEAPVLPKEVLFCEEDGTKLDETRKVQRYDVTTGEPSVFVIQRTCPTCHAVRHSTVRG